MNRMIYRYMHGYPTGFPSADETSSTLHSIRCRRFGSVSATASDRVINHWRGAARTTRFSESESFPRRRQHASEHTVGKKWSHTRASEEHSLRSGSVSVSLWYLRASGLIDY